MPELLLSDGTVLIRGGKEGRPFCSEQHVQSALFLGKRMTPDTKIHCSKRELEAGVMEAEVMKTCRNLELLH